MATQARMVYKHLKEKGTITNAQANNLYGIRHLPAIIRDIKKHFCVEIFDWWQSGRNRYGENCRWKVYSLHKQDNSGETGGK